MKILKMTTHWTTEEADCIYRLLNDYDLISSKLMRGTRVDYEDCAALAKFHKDELDLEKLAAHFHEMVSYDIAELRLKPNINIFLELLQE